MKSLEEAIKRKNLAELLLRLDELPGLQGRLPSGMTPQQVLRLSVIMACMELQERVAVAGGDARANAAASAALDSEALAGDVIAIRLIEHYVETYMEPPPSGQALADDPFLLNATDGQSRRTALHWAIAKGSHTVASALLEHAPVPTAGRPSRPLVDVNCADAFGATPLALALKWESDDAFAPIIQGLRERGALEYTPPPAPGVPLEVLRQRVEYLQARRGEVRARIEDHRRELERQKQELENDEL